MKMFENDITFMLDKTSESVSGIVRTEYLDIQPANSLDVVSMSHQWLDLGSHEISCALCRWPTCHWL